MSISLGEISKVQFEGKSRIVFQKGIVNPRGELGKTGIRIHGQIGRLFHNCVTLQSEHQKFYLNRKSAIKWITAQEDTPPSDSDILTRLQTILSQTINYNSLAYQKSRVSKESTSPLRPCIDKVKGCFWNKVWKWSLSSWNCFRLRFFFVRKESTLYSASETRAKAIFWKTRSTVPAYQELTLNPPPTFNEIPMTDKATYIVPNQGTERTYVGGKIPHHGQSYSSTGTTGKPTTWMIGPDEQRTMKTLMHYGIQSHIGNQPLFFLNAFAMGPWATGITTSFALFEKAMTFSIGPDIDKILDTLQTWPPAQFSDRKYVIAGYPDFMDKLVTKAKEKGFDLKPFNLVAVVGGDAISDTVRERIETEGGIKVVSAYGASDLDFPIGQESNFTDNLRRSCKENPEFATELFGTESLPMIFQYDPLNYYIESNAERQMIYTCVRDDRASPRIRYNLKDTGQIMRMSDLMAIAQKHKIALPASQTGLPLLFIWGREGAVTYQATKVFTENLAMAIQSLPELFGKIENYGFRKLEKGFNILLELKENAEIPENTDELLIEKIREFNKDFDAAIKLLPGNPLPGLEIFPFATGPMAGQPAHAKKKYIY